MKIKNLLVWGGQNYQVDSFSPLVAESHTWLDSLKLSDSAPAGWAHIFELRQAPKPDLILLLGPGPSIGPAMLELAKFVPPGSAPPLMLHLAPGYGSFQQVTSLFGPEAAIAGWARLPHIIEEDHPSLALDDKHPQSEALAEYLSSLGWPILLADGEAIQWSSVLGNLALNAIPAILLRNKSYTIDRPEWWAWEVEVMREALGVLQKAGVPLVALPGRDVPGLARAWGTLAGEALQDYMRAFPAPDPNLGDSLGFRSNHGDYLYGAIAVLADGLGWQAPLNHALALKLSDEYKQWPSYDPVGRAKTLGAILRLARP